MLETWRTLYNEFDTRGHTSLRLGVGHHNRSGLKGWKAEITTQVRGLVL